MSSLDLLNGLNEIDEKYIKEARIEKRYGIALVVRYVLSAILFLCIIGFGFNAMYKGPVAEPPGDERFSEIDSKYSGFPAFDHKPCWKLAVGMSTDDFLHEFGLDVLVEKDPERYPYDKDFCIDLPEYECRVASKDGMIVYVSVYNYRLQENPWTVRFTAGAFPKSTLYKFGLTGSGDAFGPVWIENVVSDLGTPEYVTAEKSALRKREPKNQAIYPVSVDGEADGYVVFKYRDNGRVSEIGAGIISAEEIASLPQYEQMTDRALVIFSPGLWYIPFER